MCISTMELTNNLVIKRIKAKEPDLVDTKKRDSKFLQNLFSSGSRGSRTPDPLLVRQML